MEIADFTGTRRALIPLLALWLSLACTAAFAQEAGVTPPSAPDTEAGAAETASGVKKTSETEPSSSKGFINPDATDKEVLENGRHLYEYGDYGGMVELLEQALAEGRFQGVERLEVHRLLGFGHFILQDRVKSREHFLQLLTREPDAELDPLYMPPTVIDFFKNIREENREMIEAIRKHRKGEEEGEGAQPSGPPVIREKNPYFVSFIPFGAGQFQNGDKIKGTLFLTGEIAMLGVNISSYLVSANLDGDDGYYSKDNAKAAKNWRIAQYVSLGVFTALVVGGIIDAVLNYREYKEKIVETETLNGGPTEESVDQGAKIEWGNMRILFR